MIQLKRAYDPAAGKDGLRILVDRLWPRGRSKRQLKIDLWLKELAPSRELRQWFGHEPKKWSPFKKRYAAELSGKREMNELRKLAKRRKTITLVFAAKDADHNNAVALLGMLRGRRGR